MNKKTLYERLGGYDPLMQLPTTCCYAYRRIPNWLNSGSIEERMG